VTSNNLALFWEPSLVKNPNFAGGNICGRIARLALTGGQFLANMKLDVKWRLKGELPALQT
jgi:hypothetical protein